MPDHEVCLSAFSIPDTGNQSEFFFFFFFACRQTEEEQEVLTVNALPESNVCC